MGPSPDQPFPLLYLDSSPQKRQDDFAPAPYSLEAEAPVPSTSGAHTSSSHRNRPVEEHAKEVARREKAQNSDSEERQEGLSEKGTPSRSERETSRRSRSRAHRSKGATRQKCLPDLTPDDSNIGHDDDKTSSSRESSASKHNESSALLPESREKLASDGSIPKEDSRTAKSENNSENVIHALLLGFGRSKHPSRQSSEGKSLKQSDGTPLADVVPPCALENIVSSNSVRHLAMTHDDTTEGAVHCFQDEY
ncbi:hypothetical protein LSH36_162g06026, partial [Paralvinella palmiformis]